jgi:hypothetical protein
LTEAAREYEESRAVKRKYEQVTIVTGEEDEANVLQVDVKSRGLIDTSKLAQYAYREGHRIIWDKARIFFNLKVTAGTGNTRDRPTRHAQPVQSANPVWTSVPSG